MSKLLDGITKDSIETIMADAVEKSLFSTPNSTVVTLLFEETTGHSRLLAYKI